MSAKTVHDKLIEMLKEDTACHAEFGDSITKGFGKNIKLSEVGKMLNIAFTGENDVETVLGRAPIGQQKMRVAYAFYLSVAFYEPDQEKAEERKTTYPSLIKNAIDNNLTIKGTCIGVTKVGTITISEIPYSNGIYFGEMMIICLRDEIRGQR